MNTFYFSLLRVVAIESFPFKSGEQTKKGEKVNVEIVGGSNFDYVNEISRQFVKEICSNQKEKNHCV